MHGCRYLFDLVWWFQHQKATARLKHVETTSQPLWLRRFCAATAVEAVPVQTVPEEIAEMGNWQVPTTLPELGCPNAGSRGDS